MGSLSGFRPPQFSEDVTWLPAWLQPHKFNEHIKEGKSQSEPTFKALQFHLHLSSDNNYSENTRSLLTEMSLAEISESNQTTLMKRIGTSAVPEEKANQIKHEVSRNAGLVNVAPSPLLEKSDMLGQYFSNNLDTVMKHEDNVRLLKVADISDAIELSVAASEALLIHEVMESGSTAKSLPASAILEVALRVKQARVEGFKEALNFSHEESSDIDCLSDLDESTMADAYEEVGLSISPVAQHDCDSISQVKDTYAIENCGSDDKLIHEEHGTPGVDSADIFTKQKSKDVKSYGIQSKEDRALESFSSDRRKKRIDDLAQGLETSCVEVDANSMLNCSIQENPDISSTKKLGLKKVDFAMEYVALFQETVNSSQARISENAEGYDLMYTTPNKFQSRWLGGWTRTNEGNASAAMECNGAGHILEYFVGETSLLSESAEIAPDENSFVQNQDKRSSIVSQSVPSKGLCTKNTDEMYLYEDDANSSSPSIADPLCSVVPCSISSENACSTLAHNQNEKADTGKWFSSIPEHNENNLQRSSSLDMELVNGQGLTVLETDAEGSLVIARRQVTSLRTYSMLLPSHGAFLGKESNYCDQSFPSECNENMLHSVVESPITNSTDKPRNYDDSTKDEAELLIHRQKEIGSPGTKCIFQSSKSFLHDIGGEENPEHTAVLEREAELLKVKNLQIANSHNVKAPGRKRVHFPEAKISFPKEKKLQGMQTIYTNCFTRSSSRFKSFNPYSESRAQELIRCPKKYLDKSSQKMIFQNIEFLLTGFSGKKEKEKEIEGLIRKYGGMVLSDIPSPPSSRARFRRQPIPVILCFKKLQTIKFLYGCAVKACILTVNWLTDSISAGSVLPPEKYLIIPNYGDEICSRIGKPALCNRYIFENVGIMLHGKLHFCTKMAKVVKHGGGLVFKTLQWLVQSLEDERISVGAIITEDESRVSRHLKHCASEWKIPLIPDNWIINSLYAGKLLPFVKNNHLAPSHRVKLLDIPVSMEMSAEI